MIKTKTEKKFVERKLSLNREMLRTLSVERLEKVGGGWLPNTERTCASDCPCYTEREYGCC